MIFFNGDYFDFFIEGQKCKIFLVHENKNSQGKKSSHCRSKVLCLTLFDHFSYNLLLYTDDLYREKKIILIFFVQSTISMYGITQFSYKKEEI